MQIAKVGLQRGHEIQVFAMEWQGEQHPQLPVTLLPKRGWTNHQRCWHFAQQLPRYLKYFDCIVGFNKMPRLDVYYAADDCLKAKLVQKNWLQRFNPRYRIYLNLEAAVFEKQANTHCLLLTEQQQVEFQRYYHTPANRLHLLPPSVTPEFIPTKQSVLCRQTIREEFSFPTEAKLILMVASYFQTKGVDRGIKAFAALPLKLRAQTHLLIIGQDNSQPYQQMTKRLQCEQQVHFIGARTDIARFMWASDLLLHPARSEAGGKVLLEALAAGLPILTTANCGYAGYIEQAKAGIVLPAAFEQEVLNQKLADMLVDEDWLASFKQQAKNYSVTADWFSMPQQVMEWIEKCKSS
jgi:UDP-glucose:(heptosyl)LPS alpha-1,3-glucosyltransferase